MFLDLIPASSLSLHDIANMASVSGKIIRDVIRWNSFARPCQTAYCWAGWAGTSSLPTYGLKLSQDPLDSNVKDEEVIKERKSKLSKTMTRIPIDR